MWRWSPIYRTVALHSRHTAFMDGALQLRKLKIAHQQAMDDFQTLAQQARVAAAVSQPQPRARSQTHQVSSKMKKDLSSRGNNNNTNDKNNLHSLGSADPTSAIAKQEALCVALERQFFREVEAFRPVFTMSASLELSQQYTRYIYQALRYFGCDDDPLLRQVATLVGRAAMRQQEIGGGGGSAHPVLAASGGSGIQEAGGFSFVPRSSSTSPSASSSSSAPTAHYNEALEERVGTTLPTELPHPPQVDRHDSRRRRPGALRMPAAFRGHWVLQEPEIAITREERKEDPW